MTIVHIEVQRVQSWLFEVPRLRAMVGANALLGRVMREELVTLARRKDLQWQLQDVSGSFPTYSEDDPISNEDDPSADARSGILSRDGGHFQANFASGANEFAEEAAKLIGSQLPGLRFRITVNGVARIAEPSTLSTELPVLDTCEWTGHGIASEYIKQGHDEQFVSGGVFQRHEGAKRAENWSAKDLASLLAAQTKLKVLEPPLTFEELTQSDYLAIIHADGNGVGRASGNDDESRSRFFHSNRVLLRRSLKSAIDSVCGEEGVAPLRLLMLGGDDVLVVCRSNIALKFVTELCAELCKIQQNEQGFHLTLGVGVVFAKRTIPFHRLHETAERLAASAKRRFRGQSKDVERSVVDWAVYTTSWLDDPEEARRRDWIRQSGETTNILSQRPMDVLGKGLNTLEGLLKAADQLRRKDTPRSQLRYLVDQLPQGKMLSELAFAELSNRTKTALNCVGIKKVEDLWTTHGNTNMTSLLDLVEVYEIDHLGAGLRNEENLHDNS